MTELVFGKYRIVQKLARGGMGEVFLARQELAGLERTIILKSLLEDLAKEDGFVEQFLDEARVTAALNHPNVVSIFEVGVSEGTYFIALEYIEGVDLARLRKAAESKKLVVPVQVVARVIREAALGLAYAHQATSPDGTPLKIVHRDISPQNIMVRTDGVVKVVDFGIAKSSMKLNKTATGTLKGKIQYMPPEQIRGDELDGRTDQFALGIVLWELATGARLFQGSNEVDTLQRVLSMPVKRPRQLVPDFPADLEAIIMRMLHRNRAERYASCEEVARELTDFLESSSLLVGEADVAAFVRAAVGDEISDRNIIANARDAPNAPTPQNFVIDLSGNPSMQLSPPTGTNVTLLTGATVVKARKRKGLTIGVLAAGVMAMLGLGVGFLSDAGHPPPLVGTRAVGGAASPSPSPSPSLSPPPDPPPRVVTQKATLEVLTSPSGARVMVGGELRGETPLTLVDLPTGILVKVSLQLKGFRPREVDQTLAPGRSKTISYELQRWPSKGRNRGRRAPGDSKAGRGQPVSRSEDGLLSIVVKPWANVFIDGTPRGESPLYKVSVPPGLRVVRLQRKDLGLDVTRKVRVRSGKKSTLNLDLRERK